MEYQPDQLLETDLEFLAENRSSFFHDVYEIVEEGGTAVYTCPEGWVFEGSKNITHIAYCSNWTWTADFDITKPCISI